MKDNKWEVFFNEKNFFLLICCLNLIPVFIGKFFPTMDGAMHLYNSNLINELLFSNNSTLERYFIFNSEPIPNWTGHFILSFFHLFLPAFLAEKALLLFYLIGLPFAFRALIKTINPSNIIFSYFIFPFTYSFLFQLGFYNFSIAIIFLIISLIYWIRIEEKPMTIKKLLILFVFISLTYFSHMFVFGILGIMIGLKIVVTNSVKILHKHISLKKAFLNSLKGLAFLIIASLIPLILFFYYLISRPSSGNYVFLSNSELIDWLLKIRPIIAYNSLIEMPYTKTLFYLFAILVVIALYNRINAIGTNKEGSLKDKILSYCGSNIRISDFWIISSFIILFMYFLVPDSDGGAGFVSVRFGLLFFIVLIIWLSAQTFPQWLRLLFVGIMLYCNFQLVLYYTSTIKYLDQIAVNCNNTSKHIEPNSTVLPLNYSEHWLVGTFYGYLGIDKPLVMLENYEASLGWFPLKWNNKAIPNTLLGSINSSQLPCKQWKCNTHNPPQAIDYVFVLDDINNRNDSCNQRINNAILENYILVYKNENCELFKLAKVAD